MTQPYYNCDLMPGMIADLSYEFDDQDSTLLGMTGVPSPLRELNWFAQNMKGVFILRAQSTAHWWKHIQVSHPSDGALIKVCLKDVEEWTKGISFSFEGQPNAPEQLRFDTAEALEAFWNSDNNPEFRPFLELPSGWGSNVISTQFNAIYYGGHKTDVLFVREWLRKCPYPITSLSKAIEDVKDNTRRSEWLRNKK